MASYGLVWPCVRKKAGAAVVWATREFLKDSRSLLDWRSFITDRGCLFLEEEMALFFHYLNSAVG